MQKDGNGRVRGQNCSWDESDARVFTRNFLGETRQYGVIFYDRDLTIRGWNAGAHFITGWTDAEVLGQPFAMTFVPEDRELKLAEYEADVALAMGAAEDERWHLRKDESRFWSSGMTQPLIDASGEVVGFAKVFRDATHLRGRMKYLENELQESRARHQHRDTFVGTIAHELRNPLHPLKLAADLLRSLPNPAEGLGDIVRVMDRQLGFLERLVEDLVDLTRVQAGKMKVIYQRFELQSLLDEAVNACSDTAASSEVSVHRLWPEVPIEVEADMQRLQQVVVNLVTNAIKFTPPRGEVWVTASVDQTHFEVYVKDNGRGIAPDLLPAIFDIFTQADDSPSERGAGLGIGLSVVKNLVMLHQGTVNVRSEGPGKGSEFIVRIPLRKPQGSQREPLPVPPRSR